MSKHCVRSSSSSSSSSLSAASPSPLLLFSLLRRSSPCCRRHRHRRRRVPEVLFGYRRRRQPMLRRLGGECVVDAVPVGGGWLAVAVQMRGNASVVEGSGWRHQHRHESASLPAPRSLASVVLPEPRAARPAPSLTPTWLRQPDPLHRPHHHVGTLSMCPF